MKKFINLFIAMMIVLILAACGIKSKETVAVEETAKETTVAGTEAETQTEEATLETSAIKGGSAMWYEISENGEVLTVCLDSNPTTGFQWSYVIEDPDGVKLISEEYVSDEAQEGLCGVGGTWTASFCSAYSKEQGNADMDGTNSISFIYSRQWEGESLPEKVIDLYVAGDKLSVIGTHEPDLFNAKQAEDGEYDVTLDFYDMIKENNQSCYALVGLPEVLTWTDEEVKALKAGDVLPLSKYGIYDITVERIEKRSDDSFSISDSEYFVYDSDRKAWVLYDWDNTIYKYNKEKHLVQFTDETVIEDEMEELMNSKLAGTIYEKMGNYLFADCRITVDDGRASKIVIHYHP